MHEGGNYFYQNPMMGGINTMLNPYDNPMGNTLDRLNKLEQQVNRLQQRLDRLEVFYNPKKNYEDDDNVYMI